MTTELRETGISVVGDMPWGTHFCYFYETKQDLLDILVPYFKVGLENNEFCLWVISNSELLTIPIGESKAEFLLDVTHTHQFAIARRHGNWEVVETPELKNNPVD